MKIQSATELEVYRQGYQLAMEIFQIRRGFPREEIFSLTSQIRRASRSVCQNLREAWSKRRYEAHFVSKLTDCDGENAETETLLAFAHDCGYLDARTFQQLTDANRSIGRMLGSMLKDPAPFLFKPTH